MAVFSLRNATIRIKDGAGTPKTLTVKIGDGNISWSEKKNREYMKNRGRLDTVEDGDEEPVEVSLDFRWEFLKSVTGETLSVEDVLKQRGEADDWVSTDANACAPYAVDIEIEFDPACAAVDDEVILLSDFRYESLDHDGKGRSVSCKGKCNITEPTVTRG